MSVNSMKLAENVPEHLFRNAKLQTIVDQLFENFEKGKEKNAETANRFFNQSFFRGGESFIDECAKIDKNIDFDYIKNEGITLTLLLNNKQLINFQSCLDKTNGNIEKAFKQEIFDKIKSKIGSGEPYDDFDSKCAIKEEFDSNEEEEENNSKKKKDKYETLTVYFKKITDYLQEKEGNKDGKKVKDIISGLIITNEEINKRLPTDEQIPAGKPLNNSDIPKSTREAFDTLLSFEIGEIADCAKNITDNVHDQLEALLSNAMPAVNTIVGENDELKFDENKLGDEFKNKLQELQKEYQEKSQSCENETEPIKSEIQSIKSEIQKYQAEINRIESDNTISNEEKEKQKNEKRQEINKKEQEINKKEQEIIEKYQPRREIEGNINNLKREYYLKYLKEENSSLGETLELLYKNNFDYSKIDEDPEKNKEILQKYLNKVADIRLKMSELNGTNDAIKAQFGNHLDFDKFENFYKNLFNLDEGTLEIFKGVHLPVKKTIVEGPQAWLKDISKFGDKGRAGDTSPIRLTFKKDDIDKLPISEENKNQLHDFLNEFRNGEEKIVDNDKPDEFGHNASSNGKIEGGDEYTIGGGDIGRLIYLYFLFNYRSSKSDTTEENEKKAEDIIENKETGNESGELIDPENFKKGLEELGPGKLENGSEIWIPYGKSELPGGGFQMMKVKISDVNMRKGTFKGVISGGELKFSSKLEGKSVDFKMNGNNLEQFKKNKACLLPNPYNSDFNDFRNNKLKNKLGTDNLKFPPEGGGGWENVKWDGNRFIKKFKDKDGKEKEVEIKYFGENSSDNKYTYKIDYNPHKRSFTVSSSFNGEGKGKDGKVEPKRFSYKREMDWNNFLFFFTQKGLQPQTEEESKKVQDENDYKFVNDGKLSLQRFSLNNLKNGFKDIIGSIKKGIEKYDKDRTEDFKDTVEGPILKAISKMPLPPSLKYAVGQRQEEIYNEQYNSAWKKIEEYLNSLKNDEQFADTFDQLPNHVNTKFGKPYKEFIIELFEKSGQQSIKEQRQAAAFLLANIQKGGSPYRGLTEYQNEGLWVKTILGEKHHEQFLTDKERCINDLKNAGKNKDQIQTALADGEMDYIINNICGSNGKLPYFGSHEDRGIGGDETTKYIPNPSKRILSEKFANELKSAYKGWFSDSAVDKNFDEIGHNNFVQARADFKRFLTSARNPNAIANLRYMYKVAKTQEQLSDCDKYFLIYMLSGVLDVYGNKGLRKQAYQWGTTASFLPGMLAKNVGHSEQVVELLDDFCESKGETKFSEKYQSYFKRENLHKGEILHKGRFDFFDQLFKDIDERWTEKRMEEFEEYSKVTFRSKDFSPKEKNPGKPNLQKLQADVLKPGTENITNSLLENSLIANRGGLFSNTNAAHNRMEFDNGGHFTGKDDDEIGDKESFCKKVQEDIAKMEPGNVEHLNLVLNQFFNWFNISDKTEIYKWIKTADLWRKSNGQHSYYDSPDKKAKIDMGIIREKEIDSILRYTFKGKVMYNYFNSRKLPTELNDTLNSFYKFFREAFYKNTFNESKIIQKTLGIENEKNHSALEIASWDLYSNIIDTDNSLWTDNTPEKNEKGKAILSQDFINYHIAVMERRFREAGGLDGQYMPIRGDIKKAKTEHLMAKLNGQQTNEENKQTKSDYRIPTQQNNKTQEEYKLAA